MRRCSFIVERSNISRNSSIIGTRHSMVGHRMSIYMPNIFFTNSRDPHKSSKEQKILVLQSMLAKKDILFGKFTGCITKREIATAWTDIVSLALSYGLVADPDEDRFRRLTWQNWRRNTMAKIDRMKRTGIGGASPSDIMDEGDKLVLAIVGEDLIVEINSQVALFRDMLIHVGQSKDCPELREKIRKLRRSCIEACKHTVQVIMPQVKSAVADGVLTDNPHLVLLFYLSQLFLRELVKSYRLIQVVPMDMSGYYENRAGPSNLGNVISQILLCKQITPDFNQEELCSITKDSQEIAMLLAEMQEYMPQHETYLERNAALSNDTNGPWPAKRRRNSIYKNMGLLCCVSRPNYL